VTDLSERAELLDRLELERKLRDAEGQARLFRFSVEESRQREEELRTRIEEADEAVGDARASEEKLRKEAFRLASLLHFATHDPNFTLENCPRSECRNRRAALTENGDENDG
jgi:hypothetical protein